MKKEKPRIAYEKIAEEMFSVPQEESAMLPIGQITVSDQIRTRINTESQKFRSMIESIKSKGIIQAVLVKREPSGKFRLICGERRLRAAQIIGLNEIPVRIASPDLSEDEIVAIQIVENIHREKVDAIDEAHAYHHFYEQRLGTVTEPESLLSHLMSYSFDERRKKLDPKIAATVAQMIVLSAKNVRTIMNLLTLLRLPEDVQDCIRDGIISTTHGYILAAHTGHPKFGKAVQALKDCGGAMTKEELNALFDRKGLTDYARVSGMLSTVSSVVGRLGANMSEDERRKLLRKIAALQKVVERAGSRAARLSFSADRSPGPPCTENDARPLKEHP